ncbi:PREDICTED: nudix hydrolase 21, chloroplastic-like [Camelina sativa]|uniref:Nudix hydrolase 21, chloroplastic-like n=1 Tax=Camelina sativa TaxID=90675 RepID=A0ABM0WI56_CAMSA|nr:PREDICTED: nudix hydrolase 21, chloroplastic-like [Camelina sativa]
MTGIYVSLFISNFSNVTSHLSPTFDNIIPSSNPKKIAPIEKVVSLVSRTGRDLQRYSTSGHRQVVGCVPYRYKKHGGGEGGEIEVLLISAQKKGKGMLLPKGGWEIDESIEEAALRETIEEAGVTGQLEESLGKWQYKSKRHTMVHDGYMFPLLVSQQFEKWPEADFRQRRWVSLSEAIVLCQNSWMREALEAFINRKCQTNE